MKGIINRIKNLYQSGFFDIFGATVINSIVTFIYGVFIVRILSKEDYGTFSYVQNILNFGFMFCALGGGVGLLQYCSGKFDLEIKYSYCKEAFKMGIVGSVLVPVVMLLYTQFDNSSINNLLLYIIESSFLPFFYFIKDWTTSNLRWQLKNREYGLVLNAHSLLNACFAVLGAYFFGIQGVIIGIYIAYVGSGCLGLFFLRDSSIPGVLTAQKLGKNQDSSFIKYSLTMCVVNALIAVLFTIDIFVIGNVVKDANEIAMYKAASTIPFALNMVPNSVMTFAYPYFAMHKEEPKWLKKNVALLYMANGVINICIGIALYIAAPLIISVLYGSAYSGILPVFRVLVFSYIVNSCLRTPSANLLGAFRMSKIALCVSAMTVLISATFAISFVKRFGIIGAAYGSVLTFSVVGLISFGIICYYVYVKGRIVN